MPLFNINIACNGRRALFISPPMDCAVDYLQSWAKASPEQAFLVLPGQNDMRYSEAHDFVKAQAAELRAIGIDRGSKVATVLPHSPEAITCFLAVSSVATACPVNPADTMPSYEKFFKQLNPHLVIYCEGAAIEALSVAEKLSIPICRLIPDSEQAGRFSLHFGAETIRPSDAVFEPYSLILPTSGSTGDVKLVPHEAAGYTATALKTANSLGLGPEDRELLMAPMFHAHGLTSGIMIPLVSGGTIICPGVFHAGKWLEWMQSCKPTWYSVAPAVHREIMHLLASYPDLQFPSLRFIRSGAAPLDKRFIELTEQRLGVTFIEAYGLSEAPHVSGNPLGARRIGSVGKSNGPDIAILGIQDEVLPSGEEGEIAICGATVFHAYADKLPTPPLYREQWFRTGDLGYLDSDGYLFITGRLKEIINKGGLKIMPLEVDAALCKHPEVAAAMTFSVPHPTLGEEIAAAIIRRKGRNVSESDLRAFIEVELGAAKVPVQYVFVESFPKGPTGKFLRRKLIELLPDEKELANHAPQGPLETAVAETFARVLNLTTVSRKANFRLLGGDSLRATRAAASLRETSGKQVRPSDVLRNPVVQDLALVLNDLKAFTTTLESNDDSSEGILSLAEQRLAFLELMEPGTARYNLPAVWTLKGPVQTERLKSALTVVVERHQPLRTAYLSENGRFQAELLTPECIDLCLHDLSSFPEEERRSKSLQLLNKESSKPFSLKEGKLRCHLIHLAEDDHILLAVFHHISSDGWSLRIFQRDLLQAYSGTLPALNKTYRDVAIFQRRLIEDEVFVSSLSYWEHKLKHTPGLTLPTEKFSPENLQGAVSFTENISSELQNQIEALALKNRATSHMVMLAVAHILLARWSGQNDFAIGIPVANRSSESEENLIGLFVNMLPIRNSLEKNDDFSSFLARVRAQSLEAYDYLDTPFDLIVQQVVEERQPGQNPVFQVVFQAVDFPEYAIPATEFAIERIEFEPPEARFDLEFLITRKSGSALLTLMAPAAKFSKATIERIGRTYIQLLQQIVTHPQLSLHKYDWVLPDDMERMREWNQTTRPYAGEENIAAIFERQVEASPEVVAICSPVSTFSYVDVSIRVNAIAFQLQKAGVSSKDRVAVFLPRSADVPITLLAILKLGGIYVPLDPEFPRERLAVMLNDSLPRVVVAVEATGLPNLPEGCDLFIPDFSSHLNVPPVDTALVGGDHPAYLMYSSGSTGQPKGILVPHRGIARLVLKTHYFRISCDDVFLHLASPSFDAATFEYWGPLLNGATLAIPPEGKLSLSQIEESISSFGVTTLWLTAGLFHLVVDERPQMLARLKQLLAGGDALSPRHVKLCRERFPKLRLINGYGPTENTTFSCCYDIQEIEESLPSIPIGFPIENSCAWVVDENNRLCPPGVVGEILLGGDGLALGYWNDPELTNQRFVELAIAGKTARYYRSGDFGRWLPDGRLLFEGRRDGQVKVRGFRVELDEIRAHLEKVSGVLQASVVRLEGDTSGDQSLGVAIVPDGSVSLENLRTHLEQKLPVWMVPQRWISCSELPLTLNGKVDRRKLARQIMGINAGTSPSPLADLSTAEQKILQAWQAVFPGRSIKRNDDFFAMGGHSLLAMRLVAEMEKRLNRKVPLSLLFAHSGFTSFCRALENTNPRVQCLLHLDKGDGAPLIIAHGLKGEIFAFQSLRQQLAGWTIYGLQSTEHSGGKVPDDFAEMVQKYAEELYAELKGKPINFLGYSMGGLVAFETARCYQKKGGVVNEVILLDTHPNNLPLSVHLLSVVPYMLRRLPTHLGRIIRKPFSLGSEINGRIRAAMNLYAKGGRKSPDGRYQKRTPKSPDAALNTTIPVDVYEAMCNEFSPSPAHLNVTVIRSQHSKMFLYPRWRYLCRGRLRFIPVEFDHHDMIKDAGTKRTVEILKRLDIQ